MGACYAYCVEIEGGHGRPRHQRQRAVGEGGGPFQPELREHFIAIGSIFGGDLHRDVEFRRIVTSLSCSPWGEEALAMESLPGYGDRFEPARTPRAFHRDRQHLRGRPASRCRTRGFPPVRTRPCGRRSSPPPAPSPARRSDRLSPPPLSPARRAGSCGTPPPRIALC